MYFEELLNSIFIRATIRIITTIRTERFIFVFDYNKTLIQTAIVDKKCLVQIMNKEKLSRYFIRNKEIT